MELAQTDGEKGESTEVACIIAVHSANAPQVRGEWIGLAEAEREREISDLYLNVERLSTFLN